MSTQKPKQAITLKIAGRTYPFNIERDKEEVYRLAEREVNAYLAQIKQQRVKGWEDADYAAIAALSFAINLINTRRTREVGEDELGRLQALEEKIALYLERQE
ncbi:MAG: cell division protein ZapA [Alistipes sp.]|nr:cell division protein ZapA [Alistipes sp.]